MADVQSAVAQQFTRYFMTIPIDGAVIKPAPGKVSWRAIEGQIEAVSPFVIEAKLSPEADTVLGSTEVALANAGLIVDKSNP